MIQRTEIQWYKELRYNDTRNWDTMMQETEIRWYKELSLWWWAVMWTALFSVFARLYKSCDHNDAHAPCFPYGPTADDESASECLLLSNGIELIHAYFRDKNSPHTNVCKHHYNRCARKLWVWWEYLLDWLCFCLCCFYVVCVVSFCKYSQFASIPLRQLN